MILPEDPPGTDRIARHYDELDFFYRDVWGEHVHHGLWVRGDETPEEAVLNLVHHVAKEAGLRAGEAVCDVGCGYGATARLLTADYGVQVTGLTISEAQHTYACSVPSADRGPAYLLRDWLDNGLPPASFDVVIAIESLSHMHDKQRFFSEAARVLRPGGRLVVCAWLAAEQPAPWARRHLLEPICREGRLPGLAARSEAETFMDAAGFQQTRYDDLSQQVRQTWPVCIGRVFARLLREPKYRQYLLDASHSDRRFLLTMLRLWLAYLTGAMRYGLFSARKPG